MTVIGFRVTRQGLAWAWTTSDVDGRQCSGAGDLHAVVELVDQLGGTVLSTTVMETAYDPAARHEITTSLDVQARIPFERLDGVVAAASASRKATDDRFLTDLRAVIARDGVVAAIKFVRERYPSMGLKEAKDYVDGIE